MHSLAWSQRCFSFYDLCMMRRCIIGWRGEKREVHTRGEGVPGPGSRQTKVSEAWARSGCRRGAGARRGKGRSRHCRVNGVWARTYGCGVDSGPNSQLPGSHGKLRVGNDDIGIPLCENEHGGPARAQWHGAGKQTESLGPCKSPRSCSQTPDLGQSQVHSLVRTW